MNRRGLRIAALVWAFLWFGVIVPGHQRGVVTVPGTRIALRVPDCCAARANPPASPADHSPATPPGTPGSPGDPAQDCLLCHMTARLDMPMVFVLPVPVVTLLGELPPLPLRSLAGVSYVATKRGRDPPRLA